MAWLYTYIQPRYVRSGFPPILVKEITLASQLKNGVAILPATLCQVRVSANPSEEFQGVVTAQKWHGCTVYIQPRYVRSGFPPILVKEFTLASQLKNGMAVLPATFCQVRVSANPSKRIQDGTTTKEWHGCTSSHVLSG
jgi:hypothetical protein